jgi:prepilin-type N-terminal cleavage/methylation domain-containing protein
LATDQGWKLRIEMNRQLEISRKNCGFTLVELLVAMFISGMVVSLAGTGLVSIGNASQQAQSETTDRLELDRAVMFMSEEVKMSRAIDPHPPQDRPSTIPQFKAVTNGKNVRPILVLTPAIDSGLSQSIVYYLTETPPTSMWRGPLAIYRWGPTLLQDGSYSNGDGKSTTDPTSKIAPGNVPYFNELVVDGIGASSPSKLSKISSQLLLECDASTDLAIPPIPDRQGFYVCVDRSTKAVKIWLHKQPQNYPHPQFATGAAMNRSN